MLSLFHSRPRAEQAIACIGRETPASQLSTTKYTTPSYEPRDYYPKVVVPPLSPEVQTEMKRGSDPVSAFRKFIRNVDIRVALENVRARKAFALSKSATAWLPSH
jgi:hypothetical protein